MDGGTDRRVDRTGYAGTGGRLTIVSGQEGGHRAPDAPGERQTTRQRCEQTIEREREATIPCVRPMRAMQFPAGPSVCLFVRSCMPLTPLFLPLFAYKSEHSRDHDGI